MVLHRSTKPTTLIGHVGSNPSPSVIKGIKIIVISIYLNKGIDNR